MQNIKLILAYDGSMFQGSATQKTKNTVQDKLQECFEILNIDQKLNLSGRTDKNVHATKQVASIKIPNYWKDISKLKSKLNQLLPNAIHIRYIQKITDDFHARFSAKKREYRYLLSKYPTTVFNDKYLYYHPNLDIEEIKLALPHLIGVYDFEYFSKKGSEPKSTIREIFDIKLYSYKDIYVLKFCANSYLRSQIRMIVSFLLKISDKKLTITDLKNQLLKKEQLSWTVAPSNGLYLSKIFY